MFDNPQLPRFDSGGELHWWVKVVEYLQQNWAVIVRAEEGVVIVFANDLGGIFDWIEFSDEHAARTALIRNGFEEFDKDPSLQEFLQPPSQPKEFQRHPNGPIYSSGRFWKS